MVVDGEIPRDWQTLVWMEEVNWAPRSDVRTEGTPNLATQVKRNALAQDSPVMELNGATSHLWQTSHPVNNGEEVGETMAGWKRAHKIKVNVGKPSGGNRYGRN